MFVSVEVVAVEVEVGGAVQVEEMVLVVGEEA